MHTEEQSPLKVILLNIVGGIIVNNLLSVAVNTGLPKVEGDIPFQGVFLQTTLIAVAAGALGGLILSLSLMLYYPTVKSRHAMILVGLWAAVLGVLWALTVTWGLSIPTDSEQGPIAALVMVFLPPLALVTGWALTSRLVNGYLSRLEGRLMVGVVVVGALLNFLTFGGVFVLFRDFGTATGTGVVFGGIMGVLMARMMGRAEG